MLACARIGAVHSVVFGGFAANELAVRIDDCNPKAIIAAVCGIEPGRVVAYKPLLDGAIELATTNPISLSSCSANRQRQLTAGRDLDWHGFQQGVCPADCVPVRATIPPISSIPPARQARPKALYAHRRPSGRAELDHENIYDVDPGECFWAASDVGWVVGHSYICYAPLILGMHHHCVRRQTRRHARCGHLLAGVSRTTTSQLFHRPHRLSRRKARRSRGRMSAKYDLSCLRSLYLAGERADPDTIDWAADT